MRLSQNGGKEEIAALGAAFPSKTRAAPPSKEALAAMGEDGSGLSMEAFLASLTQNRPNPAAFGPLEKPGKGKLWGSEAKDPGALHDKSVAPPLRIRV